MRYLITGGAGFIGSQIRQALLARGHQCVSVDIQMDTARHPRLLILQADVTDGNQVGEIFRYYGPFDAVFHCASQRACLPGQARTFLRTNVHATRFIAEGCIRQGTKKLVYLSSSMVYGNTGSQAVSEAYPPMPVERFGKAKLASESMLWQLSGQLTSVILRLPPVIGTGQPGVSSVLFELIREGRNIWIVGKGKNRRQLAWAPDVVDASLRALDYQQGSVFNLGSAEVPTLNHQYLSLIMALKSHSRLVHLPELPVSMLVHAGNAAGIVLGNSHAALVPSGSYVGDISAAQSKLGWKPTRTNTEMLIEAYLDYEKNYALYQQQQRRALRYSAHSIARYA